MVKLWPTPSASDCGRTAINPILTANGTIRHKNKAGGKSYARLDAVAAMFPTPIASDWKNRGCKDYRKNREFQLQTTVGGQLNPNWVEWLMGFPFGWTDPEREVDKSTMSETGHWLPEPDIPRIAVGVKDRVNRLKCLGNAVVPQQFYPVFRAIAEIEKETEK